MPDIVRLPYLASAAQLCVPLGRVVEPGETVSMPRDVYERYAWGADWGEPAKPPTRTKKDEE